MLPGGADDRDAPLPRAPPSSSKISSSGRPHGSAGRCSLRRLRQGRSPSSPATASSTPSASTSTYLHVLHQDYLQHLDDRGGNEPSCDREAATAVAARRRCGQLP